MQTWSGSIQGLESGKAIEHSVVDDEDQVGQGPVKGWYELGSVLYY